MKPIQLNIDSLQHRIGQQIILQNINLNLDGFQAVTVLGPNGAGKSSLMKAMAGHFFLSVWNGTIKWHRFFEKSSRIFENGWIYARISIDHF